MTRDLGLTGWSLSSTRAGPQGSQAHTPGSSSLRILLDCAQCFKLPEAFFSPSTRWRHNLVTSLSCVLRTLCFCLGTAGGERTTAHQRFFILPTLIHSQAETPEISLLTTDTTDKVAPTVRFRHTHLYFLCLEDFEI